MYIYMFCVCMYAYVYTNKILNGGNYAHAATFKFL